MLINVIAIIVIPFPSLPTPPPIPIPLFSFSSLHSPSFLLHFPSSHWSKSNLRSTITKRHQIYSLHHYHHHYHTTPQHTHNKPMLWTTRTALSYPTVISYHHTWELHIVLTHPHTIENTKNNEPPTNNGQNYPTNHDHHHPQIQQ